MNVTAVRVVGCAFLVSLGFDSFCWGEPPISTAPADTNPTAELVAKALEFDRKGDHASSLKLYNEAIGQDPSNANAYYRRGLLYLVTGRPEKSLFQMIGRWLPSTPPWGLYRKIGKIPYLTYTGTNRLSI